jgi:hypothetical protein
MKLEIICTSLKVESLIVWVVIEVCVFGKSPITGAYTNVEESHGYVH